jgi:hypothetical protein
MKITGSTQRLCCGAWLLAAVLIGSLNVFALISLEARPTAGFSPTIRELRTNLQRLEAIQSAHGLPFQSGWELPAFFRPSPAVDSGPAAAPSPQARTEDIDRGPEPTPLPVLAGIIRTLEPRGTVSFQAVLNGRSYRKNDRIEGFTVDQITPAGVVLRCTEQTWFIRCPKPLYSSDQGE